MLRTILDELKNEIRTCKLYLALNPAWYEEHQGEADLNVESYQKAFDFSIKVKGIVGDENGT